MTVPKHPILEENKHFTLYEVGPGVYAAIQRDGGWAISNAGIVDLGDDLLVYDTFLSHQAAQALRDAAERVAGKFVRYVVNSHYHNDHIWGNQVFEPEAAILATSATRNLVLTEGKAELEYYSQNADEQYTHYQVQVEAAQTEAERQAADFWRVYYQALAVSMPNLEVCLPNLVFTDTLDVYGSQRKVILRSYLNAHTGCDTVLYVPDAQVVFMADLLFVRCHPYLAEGEPEALLCALDSVKAMEADVFIPGHGEVGSLEDLDQLHRYVKECQDRAGELYNQGVPLDQLISQIPPEPYSDWDYPAFYPLNLRHYYQRLEK